MICGGQKLTKYIVWQVENPRVFLISYCMPNMHIFPCSRKKYQIEPDDLRGDEMYGTLCKCWRIGEKHLLTLNLWGRISVLLPPKHWRWHGSQHGFKSMCCTAVLPCRKLTHAVRETLCNVPSLGGIYMRSGQAARTWEIEEISQLNITWACNTWKSSMAYRSQSEILSDSFLGLNNSCCHFITIKLIARMIAI